MCAGLSVFNGLRQSSARAGDLVAIQGIGGLGHLGIQYARAMGIRQDDGWRSPPFGWS